MITRNITLSVIVVLLIVGGAVYIGLGKGGGNSVLHAQLAEAYAKIPTASGKALFQTQSGNLTKEVDPILVDLDSQIISCGADVDGLIGSNPTASGSCVAGATNLSSTTGMFLGGQCCGAMKDTKEYTAQLEKMQMYKDLPDVPLNPHKTPIPLAKKWIDYDKATTLTPQEQSIFDQAIKLSKEGPCCCKCWHYYVNEGIAKKMIKDYHYSAQQVAAYWDASSIC